MNDVKIDLPLAERHVGVLAGLLLERLRDAGSVRVHADGLRRSHVRILSMVPAEGVDVSGLAVRAGMTTQGAGQFVSALVASGHLVARRDSADGRRRRVHRTRTGHHLVLRTAEEVRGVERRWAEEVGPERYAVFREVLEDLVLDLGGAGD